MAVLKELILTVSSLGRCGSLERTDFISNSLKELLWEGMAVLKELILTVSILGRVFLELDFYSFYFKRGWQS